MVCYMQDDDKERLKGFVIDLTAQSVGSCIFGDEEIVFVL